MAVHGATSGGQFKMLTHMISWSLAESSRRVYANTYRQWWTFAERHRLDYLGFSYGNILAFLNQSDIAFATRQSWKTHMLCMLDWLEEAVERGERYGKQRRRVLKFVKVKRMEAERGRRSSQEALKRTELAQLLDVWSVDPRRVGIRNQALLRLMIYTGLRRAEVVTLRWDDIYLDVHTVTARHGKGEKRRVAAIADVTETTKRALCAL